MSDQKRQTPTQKFRDNATAEEWQDLVDLAMSTSPIGKLVQEKYGFSWNSISTDAADKGYYKMKKRASTSSNAPSAAAPSFGIDDITEDRESVSRSVQIYTDIMERLKNLENSKRQYTHKDILNQLLDEALKKYGY